MRFKITPQLPGAGRARAWHHHGSHTPTSPGAILQVKWPITPNKSAGSVFCNKNSILPSTTLPQYALFLFEKTHLYF